MAVWQWRNRSVLRVVATMETWETRCSRWAVTEEALRCTTESTGGKCLEDSSQGRWWLTPWIPGAPRRQRQVVLGVWGQTDLEWIPEQPGLQKRIQQKWRWGWHPDKKISLTRAEKNHLSFMCSLQAEILEGNVWVPIGRGTGVGDNWLANSKTDSFLQSGCPSLYLPGYSQTAELCNMKLIWKHS